MEMIARVCPACGSQDSTRVYREANFDFEKLDSFAFSSRKTPEYMHYRLILCPSCGLLYANPTPSPAQLASAYREAAFESQEEARFAARTYIRFLGRFLKKLPGLEGALDVGTGEGAFLEELLGQGFKKVQGIEPSEAPWRAAKDSLRPLILRGLFNPKDFDGQSFSLVTCFQTLEHLMDPLEMCGGFHQILREGGAFCTVAHDREAFSAKLLGERSPIYDIEHLQLFSKSSLKGLLKRAGFSEVEVYSIPNRYPLHYWARLFPFPPGMKSILMDFFKKTGMGRMALSLPAGNMAAIGFKRSK